MFPTGNRAKCETASLKPCCKLLLVTRKINMPNKFES